MSLTARGLLARRLEDYVRTLCAFQPDRHVGGPGNDQANAWLAGVLGGLGYEVERLPFECVDWVRGGDSWLEASGERFGLHAGPYSLPADLESAELLAAGTADNLAALETAAGRVLLLHAPLTSDQLVPRNYPFYGMDEHTRVLGELDRLQPATIVALTGANPGAVGALSPFPYIEDADVHIPSAFLHEREGARLLAHVGERVHVRIDSGRRPSRAEQLVARLGGGGRRAVVCAHVDARHGTPGALDNAAGVACLLGAAQLLAEEPPVDIALEVVPFNGEDNFAAYGEMAYLGAQTGSISDVALAINIDAAGYRGHPTAISFYGIGEPLEPHMTGLLGEYPNTEVGPAWPQSDHMVFAMRGVPTLAVTTAAFMEIASKFNHTERDVPGLVDGGLLAEAADFIAAAIRSVRMH